MAQLIECSEPGCGRIKRETNRWFVVYSSFADGISIRPLNGSACTGNEQIVCGEACALKAVSRLMGEME